MYIYKLNESYEIMNILKPSVILLASLGLVSCGEFEKGFNEQWEKDFAAECAKGAEEQGGNAEIAAKNCECITKELVVSLDGITEKADPPVAKVNAALEKCVPGSGILEEE